MAAVIIDAGSGGGTSSVSVGYTAGVHTYTVSSPDWQTGDVVAVMLGLHSPADGSGSMPSAPAGWTLAGTLNQDCLGGYRQRAALYWKVRAAGDGATYTFTAGAATAQDNYANGFVFIGRGVKSLELVGSASTVVIIGSPWAPVSNQSLIAAQYTKAGDIAGCMLGTEYRVLNTDGNVTISRYYYPDIYPIVPASSGTALPVSYDAIPSGGVDAEGAVYGFRFNMPAKKGAGLFGGRLF